MADFFENLDKVLHSSGAASLISVDPSWRPTNDFVICRDVEGRPTAVYGGAVWDLNPVRLKASRIPKINFRKIFD